MSPAVCNAQPHINSDKNLGGLRLPYFILTPEVL